MFYDVTDTERKGWGGVKFEVWPLSALGSPRPLPAPPPHPLPTPLSRSD